MPIPSPEIRRAVAPLLVQPATTAIVTDFDGTLAPIVDDPARARPVDGTAEVVGLLARRFGVAAVVSGRPASFLWDMLGGAGRGAEASVETAGAGGRGRAPRLVGLYGLEWARRDGSIALDPAAERWRSVVGDVAQRIRSDAPPGVLVESKGVAVTVHWRRAPEAAAWADARVAAEAGRTGLVAHPGRMSLELRPPLPVDKGTAIERLVTGCSAACYFGDDLGDLPAFGALARMSTVGGMATVAVAVADDETPSEVAEAADVVVSGPRQALALLRWLAEAASPSDGLNAPL